MGRWRVPSPPARVPKSGRWNWFHGPFGRALRRQRKCRVACLGRPGRKEMCQPFERSSNVSSITPLRGRLQWSRRRVPNEMGPAERRATTPAGLGIRCRRGPAPRPNTGALPSHQDCKLSARTPTHAEQILEEDTALDRPFLTVELMVICSTVGGPFWRFSQ